jgi:hypothetical protein
LADGARRAASAASAPGSRGWLDLGMWSPLVMDFFRRLSLQCRMVAQPRTPLVMMRMVADLLRAQNDFGEECGREISKIN